MLAITCGVANRPEAFNKTVLDVLTNPAAAARLVVVARRHVEDRHDRHLALRAPDAICESATIPDVRLARLAA